MRHRLRLASIVGLSLTLATRVAAQPATPSAEDRAHRAIFEELVQIDSSPAGGGVSRAAAAMARHLRDAGLPSDAVVIDGPSPTCHNVVATLAGRDRQAPPILLLAHLDVVNARREDWKADPFVLRESGGWFYGRGVLDNKAGASVLVASMADWARGGFAPARDLVVVLTCDEETDATQGMQWVLTRFPRLKTAEYALNTDAGGVMKTAAGRVVFGAQAAEKVYATFTLTATNPGGHSSAPRPDNAIYALASALQRLAVFRFPIGYNDVTRASFARGAPLETGPVGEDMAAAGRGETSGAAIERLSAAPHLNAQLRTTCVATMLSAGHAENALPQSATATINCRILPGEAIDAVRRQLVDVVADPALAVTLTLPPVPSPPTPLRADVMRVVERLSAEFWPGSVVVPEMSNGATDGLYLRNAGVPVYGVSALQLQPEDDFAHGLDERVPVASLYRARAFWDRLVRSLTAAR